MCKLGFVLGILGFGLGLGVTMFGFGIFVVRLFWFWSLRFIAFGLELLDYDLGVLVLFCVS